MKVKTNKKLWTTIALLVIGTLVGSSLTLLFVPKQIQEKAIPLKLLKEDVNFLFKSIEEIHPNPYAYTNKTTIYELKNRLMREIGKPLTQLEFYKLIAPLVASLKEGHTFVIPAENIKGQFPLKVKVFEKGVL
jgi:hypothetical protein